MHTHFIAILLAAVAIGSSSANPSLVSGPSKMFEIMSSTSEVQRNNPALATACFTYYQGVFDEDYKVYEAEYAQCEDEFGAGRNGVLEKYNSNVKELSDSTYASCKALIDCDQRNNSLDSLNCYSAQGTENSKEVYSVATNASIAAGSLNQEITNLGYTRDACTSNSARNYESRSAKSYESFQSCLAGKTPVPEPTTTTTRRPTTTPEPTTTESSTNEPTTTPRPTETTDTTRWEEPTTTTSQPIFTTDEPSSSWIPPTYPPSTLSPFSHGHGSAEEKKQWMNKLDNILKHLL
ncbi:G8 domain-containing protein DDB_G0286311 [Drosophila serrata]|uniref:G8 domain-containing protein DDB_G0286311 n=1 Tax=Drosophila serrata TaxID=7274 RepID=UPI000A1D0FF4|nr:G8 domain-containing protein DDB_G0286311 [Drosophila serrata]